MRRKVLFVQGAGERVHDDWDGKLVASGAILINALAEHPPERVPGAIVLIAAPFVGEGGWQSDDWAPQRRLGEKLSREIPIFLFFGLADDTVPASHAELYERSIPQADLRRMPGRDHQFNNDLSEVAAVIRSLDSERVR